MLNERGKFCGVLLLLSTLVLTTLAFSQALPAAQTLGPEDQSKQITFTVWLKQHNQNAFDTLVRQMYDKSTPNYHHWLTIAEYNAPRCVRVRLGRPCARPCR